jgi:hypothetical protein
MAIPEVSELLGWQPLLRKAGLRLQDQRKKKLIITKMGLRGRVHREIARIRRQSAEQELDDM